MHKPHIQLNQTRKFNPKPKPKLPHILSESSLASTPKGGPNKQNTHYSGQQFTYNAQPTYSSTPSQASSVWNWENFYPPSPPDSEYFNHNNHSNDDLDSASVYSNHDRKSNSFRHGGADDASSIYSNHDKKSSRHDFETASLYSNYEKKSKSSSYGRVDDKSSVYSKGDDPETGSVYSNYERNYKDEESRNQHNHHLESDCEEEEESEIEAEEREEVQCSEWGDHYSTTTSSSDDEMAERESRSEAGTRSNFGSSVHSDAKSMPFKAAEQASKSDKFDYDAGSSASWNHNSSNNVNYNAGRNESEISDMNMNIVVRHRDLAEIVAAIKEYFDKAASSGDQVSEMLETGRAQLDRSFKSMKSKLIFWFLI